MRLEGSVDVREFAELNGVDADRRVLRSEAREPCRFWRMYILPEPFSLRPLHHTSYCNQAGRPANKQSAHTMRPYPGRMAILPNRSSRGITRLSRARTAMGGKVRHDTPLAAPLTRVDGAATVTSSDRMAALSLTDA